MHRHSRARCKRKIKKLALKSFFKRVLAKRREKLIEARKPKGRTIYGPAKHHAKSIVDLFPNGDGRGWGSLFDHSHRKNLNQRQKRKRWRQTQQRTKK